MQPTDIQLLLLNAALATLIGGVSIEGRQQVAGKRKINSEQVQLKSEPGAQIQPNRQSNKMHECYVHTPSSTDVMKLTCDRGTVGCITRVNITKSGWHGVLPPLPFEKYVCLNASEAQHRPIGKCDCLSSKCICYCLGSNCNNRERITSITEEYDNQGTRRQSLPNWAKVMLITGYVIVAVILILLMFGVCAKVATKHSRYSRPSGRDETELGENNRTNECTNIIAANDAPPSDTGI